jgi:hydroxymethylpyrimidine/phosphomethylpyrimidine kinase
MSTSTPPVVLTIAGTDSGGAAGVAADLTTFAALGVHGACAVTAVTGQDTTGIRHVVALSAHDVQEQVAAVLEDLPVAAVKTGMLGSPEIAAVVAGLPEDLPLVVDPVLVSTSGAVLGDEQVVRAYRERLLPRATVVTPNLDEAITLAGAAPDDPAHDIAQTLHRLGPAVVLTGGDPVADTCRDLLVDATGTQLLEHPAVPTRNDHGTGCTFSAALAVGLARGADLRTATLAAQSFVTSTLERSRSWQLGRGHGSVAHTFAQPHSSQPTKEI